MAYNSDSSAVTVSQVTIRNGYYKPGGSPLYDENSRVSNFELEFDDGSREAFRLEDHDQEQTFTFTPRDTCYVKLIITGVYRGTKYNDTCISEITYR